MSDDSTNYPNTLGMIQREGSLQTVCTKARDVQIQDSIYNI
jgi:hypothetical protein